MDQHPAVSPQSPHAQSPYEEVPGSPVAGELENVEGLDLPETPWRFAQLASTLAQLSHHVLAIGPSASRLLARLHGSLAEEGVAVLPPDGALEPTRRHLDALGLEVLDHDPQQIGATLPFPPERFDLVIVLDVPYDPLEAHRVLVPDGVLLVQQCAADDLQELRELRDLRDAREQQETGERTDDASPAPAEATEDATLEEHRHRVTEVGLEVESSETFHGEGAVRTTAALDALLDSADGPRSARDLPLTVTISRYMVQARRPGRPASSRTDFSALLEDVPDVPQV